jgi:hypothetical protein
LKTLFALTLFLMTAGGMCSAQSDSQSLADVARQNKSDKKPAVVVTDDDVNVAPRPETSAAAAAGGAKSDAGKTAEPTGDAKAKPDKKGPGDKTSGGQSAEVANLKKQLDAYKAERDSWNNSAKRYEDQLANETDAFRRQVAQDALDNDKKNTALYQQKIEQTQADLAKAQAAGNSQSSAGRASSAGGSTPASQQ